MSKMSELDLTIKELHTAAQALINVANGLTALFNGNTEPSATADVPAREETKPEPPKSKPLTLEDVRGVLTTKSRKGHTAAVRSLLEKYGATKLSDISPDCYADLLKEAEGLK